MENISNINLDTITDLVVTDTVTKTSLSDTNSKIINIDTLGLIKKFYIFITGTVTYTGASSGNFQSGFLSKLISSIQFSPANLLLKQLKIDDLLFLDAYDNDGTFAKSEPSGAVPNGTGTDFYYTLTLHFDEEFKGYVDVLRSISRLALTQKTNELKFNFNALSGCITGTATAVSLSMSIQIVAEKGTTNIKPVFVNRVNYITKEFSAANTQLIVNTFDTVTNLKALLLKVEHNSGTLVDTLINSVKIIGNDKYTLFNVTGTQLHKLNDKYFSTTVDSGYYWIVFDTESKLNGLLSIGKEITKIKIELDVSAPTSTGLITLYPFELLPVNLFYKM